MAEDARVATYYDYTLPFYASFWHGSSNAVHYGFHDADTLTHEDELINTNRFLARVAKIQAGEDVLDAGCGVGGSAFWLANTVGASVVGVTNSARQVQRARALAKQRRLEPRVRFEAGSILAMSFEDQRFDVVWALESGCYLQHSVELLRELYRVLRPGGRLVIADGFLLRSPGGPEEARWYGDFLEGLVLPPSTPFTAVADRLTACGFVEVSSWDQTKAIRSSSRRIARRCRAGYPLAVLGERLHLTQPLLTRTHRAGIAQYKLIEHGVTGYGVFVATRPR